MNHQWRSAGCGVVTILLGAGLSLGCGLGSAPTPAPGPAVEGPRVAEPAPIAPVARKEARARNFLIIVADDLGNDKVGTYKESKSAPPTPVLDELAADGVLFRNAYTYPTCSAARASLITGRYGRRNGMGAIVDLDESTWELPLAEITIPEALDRSGTDWHAAALGKWHLSGFLTPSGFKHPLLQGFDRARGSLGNLTNTKIRKAKSYFRHERMVDGGSTLSTVYATTETTDDAIQALEDMADPFFLWVAYNAVHTPLEAPPASLLGKAVPDGATDIQIHEAMVEALDREVGRLLAALTPRQRQTTTIVFVGDNGTATEVVEPPYESRHAKGSVYEGGTNVPFLVAGAGVAESAKGKESAALVHAVDLMPTVLDLAGVSADGLALDGVSFAPVLEDPASSGARRFLYTERFAPVGAGPYNTDLVAVRDERYKLLRDRRGGWTLYDLQGRFDDGPPLDESALDPEAKRHLKALQDEMERLGRTLRFEY